MAGFILDGGREEAGEKDLFFDTSGYGSGLGCFIENRLRGILYLGYDGVAQCNEVRCAMFPHQRKIADAMQYALLYDAICLTLTY